MSVRDFYDGFADHYDLVYVDWDAAVSRQGAALDELIREEVGLDARDVFDCSCGIGTQAIGLARNGYRVCATDISERSVERAGVEATRLGVEISFGVADFRNLDAVEGTFDVVISCDNAIPHLLNDSELSMTLVGMWQKLRPGGLLLISTRDYDQMVIDRPGVHVPQFIDGPPRRFVFSLYDWDDDGPLYTLHLFMTHETEAGWELVQDHTRYRALPKDVLSRAVEEAGFSDVMWRDGEQAGFHQPVLTARA